MNHQIREVIFLTRTLEILMEKDGATGFSFSDKVKSYDNEEDREDLSYIAHKFYRDRDDGQYYRKDTYDDDYSDDVDEYEELQKYRRFKQHKDYLIGGHYRDLISIGHERNQMMHIDGYVMSGFYSFTLKAEKSIKYFQNEKNIKLEDQDYFSSSEETNSWVKRQENSCIKSRKNHHKLHNHVSETASSEQINVIYSELEESYSFQYRLKEFWIYAVSGVVFGYIFYSLFLHLEVDKSFLTYALICTIAGSITLLMNVHKIQRTWFSETSSPFWIVAANIFTVMVFFVILNNLYIADLKMYYLVSTKVLLSFYALVMMIDFNKTMVSTWLVVTFIPRTLLNIVGILRSIVAYIVEVVEYIVSIVKVILGISVPVAVVGMLVWFFILKSPAVSTEKSTVYKKSPVVSDNISREQINLDFLQNVENRDSKPQNTIACKNRYVQATTLNVRAKPKSNARVVDKVYKNEKLCIVQEELPWFYIKNKGWVHSKFISDKKVVVSQKKKKKLAKKDLQVWHCSAKSERASGWVEKVGKQNAINGALNQCEIRRISDRKCTIDRCYRI